MVKKKLLALLATAATALAMLTALAMPASASEYVSGQVMCVSQSDLVGVWVQASDGGSGFATMSRINNYTVGWSYTLPYGGSYQLHVGCGGTAQDWGSTAYSSYVTGSHSFTCYDVGSQPYYCQTT